MIVTVQSSLQDILNTSQCFSLKSDKLLVLAVLVHSGLCLCPKDHTTGQTDSGQEEQTSARVIGILIL
jgi:hypothetical protein